MTQIKFRRDSSSAFATSNPVLGAGEPAWETDTKKLKIGDGSTAYNDLDYFSSGGGSTTFEVVQPLAMVDGTLTLQIDEQTIQVQDGKLVANLDELGNEVNTLAGEVTALNADLQVKEDKLTSSNPIIKTSEEKANQVGYDVSGTTLTVTGRYTIGDFASQSNGIYVCRDFYAGTKDNYVDIPFELGDIIKIPYTQSYYYVSNGFFGFMNDDGMFRPVTILYSTSSGYQSRYDTVTIDDYKQRYYLNSTNRTGRTRSNATISTKATDGYRYVQLRDGGNDTVIAIIGQFGNNTEIVKEIWAKTDDDGVNYEKLLKCNILRMYPYGNQNNTIDASFDASQFGLYKGLGNLEDLAPNFETIEATTNQFDVLGTTKVNNLSLSTDSSLTVNSDGQLGLASTIPTKTSDLTNDSGFITSVPTASADTLGGVKIGDGLSITEDGTLSASGGGSGSGDVTTAGNNTFTGSNTFSESITLYKSGDTASLQKDADHPLIQFDDVNNVIRVGNSSNICYFQGTNQYLTGSQVSISGTLKTTGSVQMSKDLQTTGVKLTQNGANAIYDRNNKVFCRWNSSNTTLTLGESASSTVIGGGNPVTDKAGNSFLTSGNVTAYVTETYVNGTSGYRLYSDKYIEQWGSTVANSSDINVTLIKEMANTNYFILHNINTDSSNTMQFRNVTSGTKTTTQFQINNAVVNSIWKVTGYAK